MARTGESFEGSRVVKREASVEAGGGEIGAGLLVTERRGVLERDRDDRSRAGLLRLRAAMGRGVYVVRHKEKES
jgi:hypothetical protein